MGFGLIFYGFLMMVEISIRTSAVANVGIDIFPDLAGYLLMLAAANRLDGYAKGFTLFRRSLYPLIAVGTLSLAIGYLSIFSIALPLLETLTTACRICSLLFQGVAFFFLFAGIISLAKEVELPGIATRARYTTVVGTVYYVFQTGLILLEVLPIGISQKTLAPFTVVSMMAWLVFLLLGEIVLFNCYRYICYEGEETLDPMAIESPIAKVLNKLFGKNK